VTLRLRLLLLGVGIVAAGLVISDVVTYNALQSFLTTRVDQQLEAAAFPVGRALFSTSGLGPRVATAPPPSSIPVHRNRTGQSRPTTRFRNGGGFLSESRASARVLVPPGTYAILRSSTGKVEAHLFFTYGGKVPTAPKMPGKLPGSGRVEASDLYFTTSAGGGGVSYQALAKPLAANGGVVVIAVPLTDLDSTLQHLLLIEVVVSLLLLVGLGALTWAMVRRDLRPLEEMAATAGAIAEGDLTRRVSHVAEGSEVGQLGVAFNTMIDGIEVAFAERAASEERLRRFLADASHELRTPLTSILGYAELFDLGIRHRPDDLAASMHHIKGEATRMGTLVEDLFLLAQLDHERPLRFEPVDLAQTVEHSAAGIRVSTPDRSVVVGGAGPVRIEGDEDRLRQVVDNLLVNAVHHAPAGATVQVTMAEVGEWAVLTVHDDGPGVDPADSDRIFEPFYRSDPSRTRSSGGAGLGLAIVKAIVEAHGGTVAVEPGPGATFVVRLPRQQVPLDQASMESAFTPR
jgi:two-component system OmpR family sensor kinase